MHSFGWMQNRSFCSKTVLNSVLPLQHTQNTELHKLISSEHNCGPINLVNSVDCPRKIFLKRITGVRVFRKRYPRFYKREVRIQGNHSILLTCFSVFLSSFDTNNYSNLCLTRLPIPVGKFVPDWQAGEVQLVLTNKNLRTYLYPYLWGELKKIAILSVYFCQ